VNSVVIYASRSGNTHRIAQAIADTLRSRGTVQLLPVDEAPAVLPGGTDLVVIGGPTEGHGMNPPVREFLDRIEPGALDDIAAAAFDTRLGWPRLLSGSAAADITQRLRQLGARVIAPGGSFIVTREPRLEPGELERAAAWATSLADTVATKAPVASV
jgi:flavodoxin